MSYNPIHSAYNKGFGVAVKKKRLELGWTSSQLGASSNMSRKNVSSIENGRGCSVGIAIRLAEALSMKYSDLVVLAETESWEFEVIHI